MDKINPKDEKINPKKNIKPPPNKQTFTQVAPTIIQQQDTNIVANTKEELIQNIKDWINLDNEITTLKSTIKDKQNKKKDITNLLVNIMKTSSIDCFDTNGGSIVYKQKKTKKTISGKYLLEQLEKYYKEQPDIAKEIAQQILNSRDEVVKDEIKSVPSKKT